ncbi:MAG: crossover junction endodeoxyribonuclease RuvC [Coprothermobacterota bacterium]|nr:crossover junction endodeoxyribonuclease RuvC [Coprothermobacterota bacterium]
MDPGTASLGVAVLEQNDGSEPRCLFFSCLRTSKDEIMPARILQHYESLRRLVAEYRPEALAYEGLYFNKNVRTALAVGAVIGVILLLAGQENLPIYAYSPLQVKMAIAGYGRASKEQIQDCLVMLLGLPARPRPDDAADALAIALCHTFAAKWRRLTEGTGQ